MRKYRKRKQSLSEQLELSLPCNESVMGEIKTEKQQIEEEKNLTTERISQETFKKVSHLWSSSKDASDFLKSAIKLFNKFYLEANQPSSSFVPQDSVAAELERKISLQGRLEESQRCFNLMVRGLQDKSEEISSSINTGSSSIEENKDILEKCYNNPDSCCSTLNKHSCFSRGPLSFSQTAAAPPKNNAKSKVADDSSEDTRKKVRTC
ncbi:hypothetical protein TNCV_1471021 [Trichonephila clavipes]|nr:hypothetical protein TNCV_1471021 [Trichonephila clavipes]